MKGCMECHRTHERYRYTHLCDSLVGSLAAFLLRQRAVNHLVFRPRFHVYFW